MTDIPRHVAVIMDGNGRWATRRGLPRSEGHRRGLDAARALVRGCAERGVRRLTLFAFSSENWRRPPEEVRALMGLFAEAAVGEREALLRNRIAIRFIGERERFPAHLRRAMAALERATARGGRIEVAVAAGYGGRWDIVQAARRAVAAGLSPEEIDEAKMESLLADGDPPDLLIRTGGERRLSNFLLWQAAYAELHFTDTLWPDFGEAELQRALDDFARRERRFGGAETAGDNSETTPESESESETGTETGMSPGTGPESASPELDSGTGRESVPESESDPDNPSPVSGTGRESVSVVVPVAAVAATGGWEAR